MEAKKIYESGKLHGVYRCGKREELVNKIPRIDKEGMPDVTGIVISGIMNFGNDADMIKAMAKDAIGCKAEDIKIPYIRARNLYFFNVHIPPVCKSHYSIKVYI